MRRRGFMSGVLILALAGCRSVPSVAVAPEPIPDQRPQDFVLAVTVFTPVELSTANLPRSLRPARYIVEADGMLRAAVGAGSTTTTFPAQTRQLTPGQFEALWRQVCETGLLDPGNPARIDGPESATRSPDRTTALIYVGYGGRRATLRLLLDRSSADAVGAERLVDRLADLAWIRD